MGDGLRGVGRNYAPPHVQSVSALEARTTEIMDRLYGLGWRAGVSTPGSVESELYGRLRQALSELFPDLRNPAPNYPIEIKQEMLFP